MLAICFLLVLAGAVAYVLLATPVYQATTAIRIDSEELTFPEPPRRLSNESAVSTEMEVLRSRELAGGVTSDGNQNHIELLRDGERQPARLSRESRLADSPIRSGDQLRVAERGWVARNPGVVVSAGATAAALIFAALIRY